ncbi:hypothetical protein PRUPE_8G223000 [Prunus persica]|uniref:Uncharacterized protein n=1 Tax=Prunus persica TaxID=3760 RepID=A0A251N1R3_PRUPE|nr:hypothetical protein PRUPE_8G223000 [Prunus persica]
MQAVKATSRITQKLKLEFRKQKSLNQPSTFLSSHLFDLASIPPLVPPVIVPDFASRIPSTVTTNLYWKDKKVTLKLI